MRSFTFSPDPQFGEKLLEVVALYIKPPDNAVVPPLSVLSYFLTPSDGLDDARPLDLLREGKIADVVADAQRYGDIGA